MGFLRPLYDFNRAFTFDPKNTSQQRTKVKEKVKTSKWFSKNKVTLSTQRLKLLLENFIVSPKCLNSTTMGSIK